MLGASVMSTLAGSASPETREFSEIMDAGAKIEKIGRGFGFTEGPVWHPDGYLIFSDIPADTLFAWTGNAMTRNYRKPSGHTNGNTLDRENRLIMCEHDGRVSRMEHDGKVTTLAERFEGKRLNSPNDVVVRSDGSLYFTDPPYGTTKEKEELGFYGVYRIPPAGGLVLLTKEFVRPNGLAFSPDEKKLYVADSQENIVKVFPVNKDGTLGAGKLFANMKSPGVDGAADGMKVDVKGNLYFTGPAGVWVYAPSGKLLGKITPPEVPANVAWGDSDYKTLYMTARTGLYRVRLKIAGIRTGGLR